MAGAEVGVLLDEARLEVVVQAEHVVGHEHLAVAAGAGADADGRDLHAPAVISAPSSAGTHSTHEGERPGLLDRLGIVEQPSSSRCTRKPPKRWTDCGVRPTWPMTGMSARDDGGDGSARCGAAFELDRVGTAFLDQPAGVLQRLLRADLVAS